MKKLLITEDQYKRIFLKGSVPDDKSIQTVSEQPYKINPYPEFKQFKPRNYDFGWGSDNMPDLTSLEGYPDNWESMSQKEKNNWILGQDLLPQAPKDDKGVPILKKKGPNGMYHWNKRIGAYVHPAYWDYPEVPAQFVLIPPKKENGDKKNNIDKLFKYNLQDQIDGNAFRKWIYKQPTLLKRINKILKKKYGAGLDKSSKYYNNKYIKEAFYIPFKVIGHDVGITNAGEIYSTVGETWVEKEGNRKQRKVRLEAKIKEEKIRREQKDTFNFYSNHPLYQYADIRDWGKLENVKSSFHWNYYIDALSNWDKVNKFFGWTDDKSVSSDNTLNILKGTVPVSTCIDPTFLFDRYIEIYMKIAEIEGTTDILLALNLKFGDINNYFGDVEKPPKLPTNRDYGVDDEEKVDDFEIIHRPASTYVDLPKLSLLDLAIPEDDEIKNQRQRYEIQNKLVEKLKSVGSKDIQQVKDQLSLMNKYTALLEMVDIHNAVIYSQSKTIYEQACDDCADCKTYYASKGKEDRPDLIYKRKKKTFTHHEDGETSYTQFHTFTRKDMCKKNGGIFLIPTHRKKVLPAGVAYGFTTHSAYCCCVNPKGSANVTINHGGDDTYTADIDIAKFCNNSVGDIRSWGDKVGDWSVDCISDWHCIADILSIAAYAFGPYGAIASAIIDLVSSAGYAIEGEDGWEMNAGLTALGAFGGFYEAVSLAGKGVKFGVKLGELGTILKRGGSDFLKIEDDIAQWAKTLSKAEKEQYEVFVALSKRLDSVEGQAIRKKMLGEMDKLGKHEKGVLAKLLKNKNTDEIIDLYNKSGKDMVKMVNTAYKGTTQFVLQATLFGGVHVFSNELGMGLKKIHDKWGFDPLGIFDDQGKVSVIDPLKGVSWDDLVKDSPEYVESIKKQLDGFVSTTPDEDELDKVFSSYWQNYKNIIDNDNINKKIMDKIRLLHKTVTVAVDDRGLDLPYIKKQLSQAEDIYNKCVEDCPLTIKEVDAAINTIKNNEKEKISEEEKYAIVATGMYVTKEDAQDFNDLLQQALEEENMEKENIEEEIKRIKSLFTEERLYGNLINEQFATDISGDGNIDEPEAISFLQSLDYIVKQETEDDLCLGPGTQLKRVYEKYKGTTSIGYKIGNSSIGCYLTIYDKLLVSHGKFTILNLFEGPSGLRYSLYVRVIPADCCSHTPPGLVGITTPDITFNAAISGWDSVTKYLGLGLEYIKIEGKWKNTGSGNDPYELYDGAIVKLLNKDYKGIPTKYKIPGIVSFDIPGFKNDTATANTPKFMKDGVSCESIEDYTQKIYNPKQLISTPINLTAMVELLK